MPARRILLAALPRAARRIPGLRSLPVVRLLAIAELALLAQTHLHRLAPGERRRLLELVRHGRGMSESERRELRTLVGKLDMRAFAGSAGQLAPVRIPKRFTRARS